ncbi:unnamed protein product [Callosobruchus maculatus]|uniref:Methionyl-tRNA formyltransferase, mitochondrial n=1 Tax=Callosobruchus maculatus TaxID=64391 RepID=A0A653C273_CALMS|nr:unnamed protein product [Callosobruchus maculatus]
MGCSMIFKIKGTLTLVRRKFNTGNVCTSWRVLFFGADKFSLYSLKTLYEEYKNGTLLNNLEIVTTTSEKGNPVQKYAKEQSLTIHSWPIKNHPIKTFDLGVVVSFGHLIPENIINSFPHGMINVHASLLPKWRGAAPIIYTLANGDTETGVTIMRIRPKAFDIGEILMQEKINVPKCMKMPELYDSLGKLGAKCLLKTIGELPSILDRSKPQPKEGITYAPKIKNDFATIKWDTMTSTQVHNLNRAVSGIMVPTSTWKGTAVKLIGIEDCDSVVNLPKDNHQLRPGYVYYDKRTNSLLVLCSNNTWIRVKQVGVYGKRIMSACDFNNGYIKKEPPDKSFFE